MHEIDVDSIKGLSDNDVSLKLKTEGYNELPSSKKRSVFSTAFEVIKEPIFLLLVASGSLYFILGDVTEGIVLLSFVFVIIGITVYQETKTENALEALKNLSSPRALVIRSGTQKRIPGREVTVGDILILSEGDRVPADSTILTSNNLLVDESLLTGESVPVRKIAWNGEQLSARPGGDDQPFVYSGTLVIAGQAIAEVKAIGPKTEMGKIGTVLQTVQRDDTRLKREISIMVRSSAFVGLTLCAMVIIVYGLTRLNWIEGILAGITLAMAILPEEFPVVLTIFLALGAWRMSRKNVLTRQMNAIETLGGVTVLCVDKTGTLTQNKMSVRRVYADGQTCELNSSSSQMPPDFCHELIEFSILACKSDPFDPMEKALKLFAQGDFAKTEHVHDDWEIVQEYPLSQRLLAMSNAWVSPDGEDYIIASKGAPEAIMDLCHLDQSRIAELSKQVQLMAGNGFRVLGVAKASFKKVDLPKEQHDFVFSFLGLVGFEDPLRPNVAGAVEDCYAAGIRVVMITGDYPLTAQNIGRQIGLKSVEKCMTGPELDGMSDDQLKGRIKGVNIFARVVPGTDVARESASLVLLDDDFASIVGGVKMGRRIFDNLKKAIAYIFAIHVPIAGISVIPVLLGWPLILLPVHIVFLELVIDPACSVVFESEPEEKHVMKRKPREMNKRLFDKNAAVLSLLQGFVVLAIIVVVFVSALNRSWTHTLIETFRTRNNSFWWILGGALLALGLVLYVPQLRSLFQFSALQPVDLIICLVAAVASMAWFEVYKGVKKYLPKK